MRRDVFQGIADPTRREILNMVSLKPLNINSVSSHFEISRAAVYKHIKMLSECGLVDIHQEGRERFCEARLEKLSEVSGWIDQYRKIWEEKLDSLEAYLVQLQSKKKQHTKKKHGRER